MTEFAADKVTIAVDVREPAWLVYADAYHADWRAQVNGREVPITPAYGALKAVPVQPGHSQVRLRFRGGRWPTRQGVTTALGVAFGNRCTRHVLS